MSERGRFRVITLLLIGALILSVVVTIGTIRADLMKRTQAALASAGVAYYGVRFDGRDAVLGGFVRSRDQAERIAEIVAGVPGVRTVRDELIVEHVVESPPPRAPVAIAELRLQRLGSMLVISGRVADSDAQRLLGAAERTFGSDHVRAGLRVDSRLEPNSWLADANTVVRIMSTLSDTGRLSVRGNQAVLGGRVRGSAERRRIDELASTLPGLRWSIDLFNARRGPTSGGDV